MSESLAVGPKRPHPEALTLTELAEKLGFSDQGTRKWVARHKRAGVVHTVQGRHETTNRPTVYVIPAHIG